MDNLDSDYNGKLIGRDGSFEFSPGIKCLEFGSITANFSCQLGCPRLKIRDIFSPLKIVDFESRRLTTVIMVIFGRNFIFDIFADTLFPVTQRCQEPIIVENVEPKIKTIKTLLPEQIYSNLKDQIRRLFPVQSCLKRQFLARGPRRDSR